jgi:NADH:ubiquinone oxidoreductase subunit 3 (subunit A)
MLVESIIAFLLIVAAASLVYVLGRRASPKHLQTENATSTYACGERAPIQKQRINVTLSKYLIFFVLLDSSVLLIAFATIITQAVNLPLLLLYLAIVLAASMLLIEGEREQ